MSVAVAAAIAMSSCSSSDVSTQRVDPPADSPDTGTDSGTDFGTDSGADGEPDDPGPVDSDVDDAERIERGTLDWAPCDEADVGAAGGVVQLECATLAVPLDHDEPDGATIDIAVARVPATGADGDRIGSVVFNPGGPGGSGLEALGFVALTMSADIQQRFDLVSFDPRGVGRSTAFECDIELDDAVTLLENGDDAGWQQLVEQSEEDLASCTDETLELARFAGTNNAARDLDLLRAALGDDGLSYVGYSYGTRLGATYAELFPENVRALVLDGAVKPTSDLSALAAEQGVGFDRALENFATACDADADCVLQELGPTLDVLAGLEAEIAEVGSFSTDDGDRRLTPGELNLGVAAALYSKDSWQFLADAIYTAETTQDGTLLQVLGDSLLGRGPDGTYDNSQIASSFINCADDPARPTVDDQRRLADAAADRSTHFDEFLRASTGCLGIPAAEDALVLGPASDAPAVLVLGSTGDPATPYEWAVELADFLDSAMLYTVEAEGHTAYGTIECVTEVVDAYLIDLVVPEPGSSCADVASADLFVPAEETEVGQVLAFFDCLREQGADVPEVSTADILADPTLETVIGELDFTDPGVLAAIESCQGLIADL